tara:strand:- start:264 stop:491 length:228 start_codon:yes stop_codon:yes gene_type:complete
VPNVYEIRADKIDYKTLKGLVISGNDKKLNPINLKQITDTFLRLGANIQTTELNIEREFPKSSRDKINDWIVQDY